VWVLTDPAPETTNGASATTQAVSPSASIQAASPAAQAVFSVRVSGTEATRLGLGYGAELLIPRGAILAGATVSAQLDDSPGSGWVDMKALRSPVHLTVNPPSTVQWTSLS
jgi:hypothetical protein